MNSLLQQQLATFRQRAKRSIWLFGLSCVVCVVVVFSLLIGYLDWTWHINHDFTRLLLGCTAVVVVILVAWRYLICPLNTYLSDVELARRLESRFPELQERLLSATEFAEHHCSRTSGSAALQQELIDEACRCLSQIDTRHALNHKLTQQSTLVIAGSVLIFATAICLYPNTSYTALRRFATPFQAPDWPQRDSLMLVKENLAPWNSQRVLFPESQPVKLMVINQNGRLPNDTKILYRPEGKRITATELKLERTTLRNNQGEVQEVGFAELQSDAKQILFRAVGGDDYDMEWRKAIFLPTPELTSVDIKIVPPEYTGLPEIKRNAQKLKPVLAHSRLIITGKTAAHQARLSSAEILFSHRAEPLQAKILSNGHTLNAEIELSEKGNYEFQIYVTDTNLLKNQKANRYRLQVIDDAPPSISITEPKSSINATSQALIPLRFVAKDDISLRKIRLKYRIGQSSQQEVLAVPLETFTGLKTAATVQLDWMLKSLALPTGTVISYFAEASDDFPGESVRWSRSQMQQIRIVSAAQKRLSLEKQQTQLLEQLMRIRNLQQNNLDNTISLHSRLNSPRLDNADLADQLKGLTVAQKLINSQITGSPHSLQTVADKILKDLINQRFEQSDSVKRLQSLQSELTFLYAHWLTKAEHQFTISRKHAERDAFKPTELKRPLAQIVSYQQQALRSLTHLISLLSEWKNSKSIAAALQELQEEQIAINQHTSKLGKLTLARSFDQLNFDEKRTLRQFSIRQRDQESKYQQLQELISQLLTPHPNSQSDQKTVNTDTLLKFQNHMQQSNLVTLINDAAEQIQANQIGRAFVSQQAILESINTLIQALDQPAQQPGNDIDTLQSLENTLIQVTKQQKQLQLATEQLMTQKTGIPQSDAINELIQKQQQVQSQSEMLAHRMQRSGLESSAKGTTQAIFPMKSAGISLAKPDLRQAAWMQQLAHHGLLRALETFQMHLLDAQHNRQQLLLQQLISDTTAVKNQQEQIQKQTNKLHLQHQKSRRWTRPLRKQLRDLTDNQRKINQLTKKIADQSSSQMAIALKWKQSLRSMNEALMKLKQQQPGEQAQTHQQNASGQLSAILKLLKNANMQSNSPKALANKWIRSLQAIETKQEDLQQYTRDLESLKSSSSQDSGQSADYQFAAESQQQLSQQLQNLMSDLISHGFKSPDSDKAKELQEQTKQIAAAMQSAATRLAQQQSDATTQSHQQQARLEISAMITELNQTAKQYLKPNPGSTDKQNLASKPSNNQQTKNNQQGTTTNSSAQQAGNNTSSHKAPPAKLEITPDLLFNDIWGHLPPRLRNRMLNVYREKYLPKYERLVEKYFEELAQPTNSLTIP